MNWYTGKVRDPLLEGESVTICGQDFIVPPSNIKRMRLSAAPRAVLGRVGNGVLSVDSEEAIAAVTAIAAIALSGNYPEISAQRLDELEGLKPLELSGVLTALRKANGHAEGEVTAPADGAQEQNDPKTGTT